MASSLVGTWKVITKTPIDENKAVWKFWEEDGKVVGTVTADDFVTPFEKVAVDGDEFELMTHLDLQFGHIQFDWKGKVEGDMIMGISRMKMGKSKFKGKRAE